MAKVTMIILGLSSIILAVTCILNALTNRSLIRQVRMLHKRVVLLEIGLHLLTRGPDPEIGRRLASIREDLIAEGIDPSDLPVPIHPDDVDES